MHYLLDKSLVWRKSLNPLLRLIGRIGIKLACWRGRQIEKEVKDLQLADVAMEMKEEIRQKIMSKCQPN